MKNPSIRVRLSVMVPFILAGFAVLALLVGFHTAAYYVPQGVSAFWPLAFWGLLIAGSAGVCGYLITRLLMRPAQEFVSRTQASGVLGPAPAREPARPLDEMQEFTRVFQQVAELLSRVEAQELFPEIAGASKAIRGALALVRKVAPTDATVLILGESGTGKELVARSVHQHSGRREHSFVAINTAAIPATLLESELFGHEKGAFTGAEARKLGKFEAAGSGTLFLDEISDMPLETQAKLLRVIQEREFVRVGGNRPIPVRARIVAASNKDLDELVRRKAFRQDLLFRINGFPIYLPPLRERPEDIPVLTARFMAATGVEKKVTPEAMQKLVAYAWPGNVRELKNSVESALLLAEGAIDVQQLPPTITSGAGAPSAAEGSNAALDQRLRNMERAIIVETLTRTGGIQVRAAGELGISERSLWHRVGKYDIDVEAIKNRSRAQ